MHTTAGYSDGVFMTSRDGVSFKRWGEAFLRPGPQTDRWGDRDNFIAWGILQTKSAIPGTPNELSLLSLEGYKGFEGCRMRRFTLRKDGFVSLQAPLSGGEMVTKPLTFEGGELVINFSTSAAGSVRFEVQDAAGSAQEGLTLEDCPNVVGDDVEHVVSWKGSGDLGELSGKPVRLRIAMKDADLYSFRFR